MLTCVICAKQYDYEFKFNLNQFHRADVTKPDYEKYEYTVAICSKQCISRFVEKKVSSTDHADDTFIVDYTFPLGFCDKCGHGTHPTEFCQQLGDYDEKTLDFHERHMAGQGSMVNLKGYIVDIFLGHGWLLAVQGVRYQSKCVQLVKDLKARVPLAVVWNNPEELDTFLPRIELDGTEHMETKDIFTGIHIKPADKPAKIEGTLTRRFFYVFQIVTHLDGIRKLFFPFQLAMDNCWFPKSLPHAALYNRFFFSNLKSPVLFDEKAEWTPEMVASFRSLDEEDQDCYEDFLKGMDILKNKQQVMEELHVNLKDLEAKMTSHVFMGQAPEMDKVGEGDNVLTEDDKVFLQEKGFNPDVIDELFKEQMAKLGLEGEIEEKKEEVEEKEWIDKKGQAFQKWKGVLNDEWNERKAMEQEDHDAHDECTTCSA